MKKYIGLLLCVLTVCVIFSLAVVSASAEEADHNHKYYFDYISRSADQSKVESFGIFCEDCDEVKHIKTDGVIIDYHIYYNGWGADGETKWYFVDGLVSLKEPVRISGTVNLVLLDDSLLICESGIRIFDNGVLNIYSEHLDYSPAGDENTMGALRSYVKSDVNDAAAIGGIWDAQNVTVNIYGGDIYAYSKGNGAAIGSGVRGNTTVNFYGGKVRAVTEDSGAAIGGGYDKTNAEINFYGGIVKAANEGRFDSSSVGSGFWECHSKVNFYGGYVYAKHLDRDFYSLPGINADSIERAEGTSKIGNIDVMFDDEGWALAKQAGWTDKGGFPIGSVLSGGSLTIIVGVAAAAVFGLGGFILGKNAGKKKKKPATADGTEKENEDNE